MSNETDVAKLANEILQRGRKAVLDLTGSQEAVNQINDVNIAWAAIDAVMDLVKTRTLQINLSIKYMESITRMIEDFHKVLRESDVHPEPVKQNEQQKGKIVTTSR